MRGLQLNIILFERVCLLLWKSRTTEKRKFPFLIFAVFLIFRLLSLELCFLNGPFPTSFPLFSSFLQTVNRKSQFTKICRRLDSNHGPLVPESTALPTEPQPLPFELCLFEPKSCLRLSEFVFFKWANPQSLEQEREQNVNDTFKREERERDTVRPDLAKFR